MRVQTLPLIQAQQCNLGYLDWILQREGYVIFICGRKEIGKTNMALFLSEYSNGKGYKNKIATNIKTEDHRITDQITNLEDLEDWCKTSGKKLFVLDELGKHLPKMGFMTKKSKLILDIIQLIWHYRAGFIGCAPSESFVDNNFLNTDILDAKIRKINQKGALIFDYLRGDAYFLNNIPKTSILYNRYDIAKFETKRPIDPSILPMCCQVARQYALGGTYKSVKNLFPQLFHAQIQRHLIEHARHTTQ